MERSRGIADLFLNKLSGDNQTSATDDYLSRADAILRIVLDVAECGHGRAEEKGDLENDDRFNDIIGLVQAYRAGKDMFIGRLFENYPPPIPKLKVGKAA